MDGIVDVGVGPVDIDHVVPANVLGQEPLSTKCGWELTCHIMIGRRYFIHLNLKKLQKNQNKIEYTL